MNTRALFATALASLPTLAQAQAVSTATPAAAAESAELMASLIGLEEDSGPSLRFYGFSDFAVGAILFDKTSKWNQVLNGNSAFYIGNLNVYLDADLTSGFRSLIEIRFLFTPNGTNATSEQEALLDPTVNHRYNGTLDTSEINRFVAWGGIGIERAYLEYTLHSLLRLRLGRFITPWGIWNVDHGSPAIVGVQKPYVIGEDFFPEAQTGGELFGNYGFSNTTLGYHLTFSNGRGPVEQYADLDNNKAIGARLWLTGRWLGELTFGASGFWSTYSDERMQIDIAQPEPLPERFLFERYQEFALAADVRFEYGSFLVQAEVALRDRVWDDDARGSDPMGAVLSDQRAWAGYVLAAYQLPWWNLRPFFHVEYYDTGRALGIAGSQSVISPTFGLNVRLIAGVVLKGSYSYARFLSSSPGALTATPLHVLGSQLSWAF